MMGSTEIDTKLVGAITDEQGYCDTCKHRAIRDESLRKGLDGEKWPLPCRNCDIERNYLWEAATV